MNYSGSCKWFEIQYLTKDLINETTKFPNQDRILQPTSKAEIVVDASDLALDTSEPKYIRIIATDDIDICSNTKSVETYYRFLQKGMI